jgi:hypothetical protein
MPAAPAAPLQGTAPYGWPHPYAPAGMVTPDGVPGGQNPFNSSTPGVSKP